MRERPTHGQLRGFAASLSVAPRRFATLVSATLRTASSIPPPVKSHRPLADMDSVDIIKRMMIEGDLSEIGTAADNRRFGRLAVDELQCHFDRRGRARVNDLSATGMRLVHRGKFPYRTTAAFTFTLRWHETTLTATGRIVWIEQESKKQQIIGVAFEELDAEQAARLRELARLAQG